MKSKNNLYKKLYAPWKYVLIYILGMLVIFVIGPWSYKNTNFILLLLFMSLFILLSTVFYKIGIGSVEDKIISYKAQKNIGKQLKGIIFFTFAVTSFMLINSYIINESPLSGNIFLKMANAYTNTSTSTNRKTVTDRPLWIFINFSPLIYSALILGTFYFKRLNLRYKILIVSIYVQLFLYYSLFVGTQKTLGDLIIILLSMFLINLIKKPIRLTRKVSFLIVIVVVTLFFTSILAGRLLLWDYSFTNTGLAQVNFDNWMLKFLPYDLAIGFAMFIYYTTHGYYGLSLCLQLPFKWTLGLGSSFAIRDLASRYLGLSHLVDGNTYPERMQIAAGWDAYSNWHTIFPWIASDLSFVGAMVLVSFSAYIYAKAWKEVLIEEKWQSVLMFTMLNIQWGYLLASNQLFQTRTTLNMFIFTSIMWIFRNKPGVEYIVKRRQNQYDKSFANKHLLQNRKYWQDS